jgi:hypothetical protein
MKLIIEDVPESLNKTLRMHWAERAKYNKKWYELVRSQATPTRKKPGRMRVTISQMRKRLLDKDNLYGSCKPIVDGLKKVGLIKDDHPDWVDLKCVQQVGKVKLTIVEIEAV